MLDAAIGFACAQTWLLWLLKNLSQVKQGSFMNNTIAGKSGFSVLWCRNQRKTCFDEGNCRGLQPAPSTDGKARVAFCIQRSKQDNDSH
jgi:hypothetical protein